MPEKANDMIAAFRDIWFIESPPGLARTFKPFGCPTVKPRPPNRPWGKVPQRREIAII